MSARVHRKTITSTPTYYRTTSTHKCYGRPWPVHTRTAKLPAHTRAVGEHNQYTHVLWKLPAHTQAVGDRHSCDFRFFRISIVIGNLFLSGVVWQWHNPLYTRWSASSVVGSGKPCLICIRHMAARWTFKVLYDINIDLLAQNTEKLEKLLAMDWC